MEHFIAMLPENTQSEDFKKRITRSSVYDVYMDTCYFMMQIRVQ
jgi:hypothetical protein